MNDRELDEILGVVRCDRCGHRIESEIECPFCTSFYDSSRTDMLPKWIYMTACFLTSPLSIYFVVRNRRLRLFEKIFAVSGCFVWFAVYLLRL